MARRKKREQVPGPTGQEWLTTYSDMVTLMLCFFVIFFNPDEITQQQLDTISSAMASGGMGILQGGASNASTGRMGDLGAMLMALPSMDPGRSLGTSPRKAISVVTPEIRSPHVRITHDERGIVITLASDAFFDPASADINMDTTRDILLQLGSFLFNEMDGGNDEGRKFRIEGHTDDAPTDPAGLWRSNWELSTARATNVLHYLVGLGISEKRFQVAGFSDTAPIADNDTPEGMAYNRRVDIIILDDAHL